jgi:hypothetical protein
VPPEPALRYGVRDPGAAVIAGATGPQKRRVDSCPASTPFAISTRSASGCARTRTRNYLTFAGAKIRAGELLTDAAISSFIR